MWNLPPLDLIGSPVPPGTVCIVTGPTSGIGKETAAELARRGAHGALLFPLLGRINEEYSFLVIAMLLSTPFPAVVLACRSVERGEIVRRLLEHSAGNGRADGLPKVDVMELDLSSLISIRRFSLEWERRGLPLHVLVNNAGLFAMSAARADTVDGLESHMATNHLGHFLLTLLLVPAMKRAAKAVGGHCFFFCKALFARP
jgi:retinol dehydrogenase 12